MRLGINYMDIKLGMSTLENWLWDAACSIRGPIDVPKSLVTRRPPKALARFDRKLIRFLHPQLIYLAEDNRRRRT